MNWYKKWSNTHLFRILGAQSLNSDAKLYLISSKFHFHFSQHSSNLDHFPIWTILSHLLLRTFLNFSNWSHHCSEKMIYFCFVTKKNELLSCSRHRTTKFTNSKSPIFTTKFLFWFFQWFWEHILRLLWDLERIRKGCVVSIYKLQSVLPYCLIKQVNKILGIQNS